MYWKVIFWNEQHCCSATARWTSVWPHESTLEEHFTTRQHWLQNLRNHWQRIDSVDRTWLTPTEQAVFIMSKTTSECSLTDKKMTCKLLWQNNFPFSSQISLFMWQASSVNNSSCSTCWLLSHSKWQITKYPVCPSYFSVVNVSVFVALCCVYVGVSLRSGNRVGPRWQRVTGGSFSRRQIQPKHESILLFL